MLDLAALDRQGVEPDEAVQLELEGVRLKTGLKLLLDQVGPDLSHRRRRQPDDHHRPGGLGGSRRPDLGRAARSSSRPARGAGCRRRPVRVPGRRCGKGPACASRPSLRRCPRTRVKNREARPRSRVVRGEKARRGWSARVGLASPAVARSAGGPAPRALMPPDCASSSASRIRHSTR